MFPAAVIDAGLGIIVRLTYYPGSTPVWRRGLRDLSTTVGDFRVDIPAGLTVIGKPAASAAGALTAGPSTLTPAAQAPLSGWLARAWRARGTGGISVRRWCRWPAR